jgi:hypothetical protein
MNGWRFGFCGPKSFCSACYQANTVNRRAIFYTYDKNNRLVIINQANYWKRLGNPRVFFASKQIESGMKIHLKRFKNWI